MTRTKQQLANMKSVKNVAPNCRKRKNPAQSERMKARHAEIAQLRSQLAAEKEVGHNQAVTLGQHIAKLEDQVQTLVDALKVVAQSKGNPYLADFAKGVLAALAKIQDQPVQLPMINDDPVVTLK